MIFVLLTNYGGLVIHNSYTAAFEGSNLNVRQAAFCQLPVQGWQGVNKLVASICNKQGCFRVDVSKLRTCQKQFEFSPLEMAANISLDFLKCILPGALNFRNMSQFWDPAGGRQKSEFCT